jgi:hypothetical protein
MSSNISPEAAAVNGLVDTYIRWKKTKAPPRGHLVYHPSAMGSCLRRMQYQRYAEMNVGDIRIEKEIEFNSSKLRLFETGHHYQERWTNYFYEMGLLKGIWKCDNVFCYLWDDNSVFQEDEEKKNRLIEKDQSRVYGRDSLIGCFKPDKCVCGCKNFTYQEVRVVDKELNLAGSADLILDFSNFNPDMFENIKKTFNFDFLPKGAIVADMKTINANGFSELLRTGPSMKYKLQLTIYANILNLDYGILIYENKNDSEMATFKIDKGDRTLWPIVKKQASLMIKMAGLEVDGEKKYLLPPPRPVKKDYNECKTQCEFKEQCHASKIWDDPKLEEKRRNFYGNLL